MAAKILATTNSVRLNYNYRMYVLEWVLNDLDSGYVSQQVLFCGPNMAVVYNIKYYRRSFHAKKYIAI